MKIVLDIKDSKADFIMELLSSFSYVKTEPIDTLDKPKKKVIKNVYQQEFAKDMQNDFEMSMLGELSFFLGLKIYQYEKGNIYLSK